MTVFFSYEDVDSTLSQASRLLAAGQLPPFFVFSEQQSQGRGQKGRLWQSPVGGIYLSWQLAPESIEPASAQEGYGFLQSLPLRIGVGLADWLQHRFGLRITLKWPNDLLWSGRKLGGILCESRFQGNKLQAVCIGIGINVQASQSLSEAADTAQLPISLQEILGEKNLSSHCAVLATELSQWLHAKGVAHFNQDRYQQFAWEEGEVLVTTSGDRFFYRGIDSSGRLRLGPVDGGDLQVAFTGDEGSQLRSWQMVQHGRSQVIADIGNSRVKLAQVRQGEVAANISLPYDDHLQQGVAEFIGQLGTEIPEIWYVGSVTQQGRGMLSCALEQLQHSQVQLLPLSKRPLRLRQSFYDAQQLGIDRLAAMEAAIQQNFHRGIKQPLLVVSAGTAITFDVIDAQSRHLGGFIIAGAAAQMQALHRTTNQLPLVDASVQGMSQQALGNDTQSAIGKGPAFLMRAAIDWLCQEYRIEAEQVFITGGDSSLIGSLSSYNHDPFLVIKGLYFMARGGS